MLRSRIIPCLDVRNGRIVKGVRFAGLRDAGDPAERARLYEQQGADEIVLLDVSATDEGRAAALDTVRAVREAIAIPLAVGGGVRTAQDARDLLEAGADKVGVNTAAVRTPALLDDLAARFGRQCVVVAIDASRDDAGGWSVVVRAGKERTSLDARDWAAEAAERGAGEILLTSFDNDGAQNGYDLDLIRAVRMRVRVPLIASGGASGHRDFAAALRAGADAALAASIFHDDRTTVDDIKRELLRAELEVRP